MEALVFRCFANLNDFVSRSEHFSTCKDVDRGRSGGESAAFVALPKGISSYDVLHQHRMTIPQPSDGQGLREAVLDGRGVRLRGNSMPDEHA